MASRLAALLFLAPASAILATSVTLSLSNSTGDGCLHFAEMWVFNEKGQLISIPGYKSQTITTSSVDWGGTVAGATDFVLGVPSGSTVRCYMV